MNDTKLLTGASIFSIAMALFVAAVAMRYQGPGYTSLLPTSLAFTAIGMLAGIASRIATSLTKRIEALEDKIERTNLGGTSSTALLEQGASENRVNI
jgi:hypothetical protein